MGAEEVDEFGALAVGKQTKVADANEASRKNMEKESAQELIRSRSHDTGSVLVGIVSPAKRDASLAGGNQATVGNGHAVGVAGKVVQNLSGSSEGPLGIHDPVLASGRT